MCGLVRLVPSDSVARLGDVRYVLVRGGACAGFDAADRKCIRSIAWLGQMHMVVDGSVELSV